MKINKTKTLIGLAIVLAIAIAVAIFSPAEKAKADELKVKGSIEQTFKSQKNGNSALGNETNISFLGKKDLDNGMTATGEIRLEDGAVDKSSIKISKNNFAVEFGADTGLNIHSNVNPLVDDGGWDIGPSGVIANDAFTSYQAHDAQHVGLEYKSTIGKFAVNYAPSSAGIDTGDSKTTDNGGSAIEYVFKGDLGIDGLTFIAGMETVESDTSTDGTEKERVLGVAYSYANGLAVGISHRDYDDESISSTAVDKSLAYSVAYSINDQWSASLERIDTDKETAGSTTENVTTATIGYSLGGLGIAAGFTTVDNLGGTSGSTGEAFQIRTVFAF